MFIVSCVLNSPESLLCLVAILHGGYSHFPFSSPFVYFYGLHSKVCH